MAKSIKEFWNRWHISLSSWFKEYLYIPLGGNRKGSVRTYINLLIVFFATGIWHGASWNFVIWGLFHGVFLIIERYKLGGILEKNKFKFINHLYTLMVVMIGWVFFRAENLTAALKYIKVLFGMGTSLVTLPLKYFLNTEVMIVLTLGILLAGIFQSKKDNLKRMIRVTGQVSVYEIVLIPIIMILCILYLTSGAYNPFIYFRF